MKLFSYPITIQSVIGPFILITQISKENTMQNLLHGQDEIMNHDE